MPNYKVLFVTYGGGHADIVCRLAKALKLKRNVTFEILALTTAGTILESEGIPFKRCRDYIGLSSDYKHAMNIGEGLSATLWDQSSGIPYDESCAYMGISMCDLIKEEGGDRAKELYESSGRKAFNPIQFLEKVLTHESPKLVVTTCYVRMEKAAVLAAKNLKIPSVLIDDLFGFSVLGEAPITENTLIAELEDLPDEVIVLNNFVKERLVQSGYAENTVHALGQPVFADWAKSFCSIEPDRSFSGNGRKVVGYIAPSRKDVLNEQVGKIIELGNARPDLLFIIKLHPSFPSGQFAKDFPILPSNVVLSVTKKVEAVVKACDLVLIFRSTVGLLCMFCDVPLVIIDTTQETDFMPYESHGGINKVSTYSELENAIDSRLNNKKQPLAYKSVFANTQEAAARISSFIEEKSFEAP